MPYMPMGTSEPLLKTKCLTCGKEHDWDTVMGWDCLVLKDDRSQPWVIWGAWCDEGCFSTWFHTHNPSQLFDD